MEKNNDGNGGDVEKREGKEELHSRFLKPDPITIISYKVTFFVLHRFSTMKNDLFFTVLSPDISDVFHPHHQFYV